MKLYDSVKTTSGYTLYIVFDGDKVYEITSQIPDGIPSAVIEKFKYIKDYLGGHCCQPMLIEAFHDLDMSWATPFMKEIYKALSLIPCGTTVSYRHLAELAGRPKAARAVGNAMAKNRFLIVIPCHRVLASGHRIGGFSSGLDMKRALLRCEGHNEF